MKSNFSCGPVTCSRVYLGNCAGPGPMPAPSPELKKLDYLVGTWTVEGDIKPGPMGPGGKVTETEKCSWMDGKFFLVCALDFKSAAMGNGSETSYMGYKTDDKVFTYDAFNSWGEAEHSTGNIDGDLWKWGADEKMGGQNRSRAASP